MKKKHIDDVQTQTVDEHYKLLLEDDSVIDPNATDVTSDDLPDWYNEKLYKKTQNYYKQNISSILVANTIGLILTFSVVTILKVLLYTKRSNSICLAYNRYLETVLHIHNLYTYDPNNTNSKWYKTMNAIRWHHKVVTKKLKSAGMEEILQRDMVLTQYSFTGLVLIAPKSFGLCNTPEENEAFNHFWRVNGYMLGIPDRFNLCRKNAKETIELCEKIKDLYATYLSKPPLKFDHIISNTIDALWYFDILINKDVAMSVTYEVCGLPYKKLGWYSWLNKKFCKSISYLYLVPYVGAILKAFIYCIIIFVFWNVQTFPVLAYLKFGKNNVRINLYPKH
ncbi:uncharacterized protein LOC105199903 isoform X1 [Solenopsis invicta]|uniref:uncharacterized protein LOC105199903 isoform X1 n=1 Tax=Solenopsis invicta TaxID=13686 RepID=UPI00193E2539|nr:uncharacterized protein LOC105199903 isoform X1 [Solenopsis invicta]